VFQFFHAVIRHLSAAELQLNEVLEFLDFLQSGIRHFGPVEEQISP